MNTTWVKLLNVKCAKTGQEIHPGEIVRFYNWGRTRDLLGYGSYYWDEQERRFSIDPCELLNTHFNIEFYGIDDAYDLFRAPVEVLNDEEKALI